MTLFQLSFVMGGGIPSNSIFVDKNLVDFLRVSYNKLFVDYREFSAPTASRRGISADNPHFTVGYDVLC